MSEHDANLLAAARWRDRQAGAAGEADRVGLQAWQAGGADRRRAYAAVSRVADAIDAASADPLLQAMADDAMARAARRRPRWHRATVVLAVAVAAPLAAVTIHYVNRSAKPAVVPAPLVVTTGIGRMTQVALPGGGTLQLDSASRAIIHREGAAPSIEVSGQAYLSGRDATAPAITVRAGPLTVTPQGADLNIRNIAGVQEVLARDGRADIARGGTQASLSAGQGVQARGDRATIRTVVDQEAVLGWRHGWLHFDDALVPSAVAEMNRYRRRPLRVHGPAIARMRISGSFRIDESDSFAALLKTALGVRVRLLPDGTSELTGMDDAPRGRIATPAEK